MINANWDKIDIATIEDLIKMEIPESKTLDYKRELPGNDEKAKKEFAADISSFANSGGGDIIYGVSEKKGIPQGITGLSEDLDAAQLRLEQILTTFVEPRIQGLRMKQIRGFDSGSVLLIRVPQSWISPHGIRHGEAYRFTHRNSAGKYSLDIGELRSLFLASEALTDKIAQFRDNRIGKVVSEDAPVKLSKNGSLIVHIISIPIFKTNKVIDLSILRGKRVHMMSGYSGSHRYNLEGYLEYSYSGTRPTDYYTQIFRNGSIESVASDLIHHEHSTGIFSGIMIENKVITGIQNSIPIFSDYDSTAPFIIMITLIGFKNSVLLAGGSLFSVASIEDHLIDSDVIPLPDILIDDFETLSNTNQLKEKLKPAFDVLWNAGGYSANPLDAK